MSYLVLSCSSAERRRVMHDPISTYRNESVAGPRMFIPDIVWRALDGPDRAPPILSMREFVPGDYYRAPVFFLYLTGAGTGGSPMAGWQRRSGAPRVPR